MLKGRNVYAVLGVLGAVALFLAGLGGVSTVYAQDGAPEGDDFPGCGLFDRIGGMFGGMFGGTFGFGGGDHWTMFDTVAEELGLAPEELFAEMRAGKTLEEVAEERGIELEAVQEALSDAREDAMREGIEQAVEDGEMSQDQAEWLLEGLEKGYVPRRGFSPSLRHGRRGMKGGFDSSFAPRWES